jgi:hypothetical protein
MPPTAAVGSVPMFRGGIGAGVVRRPFARMVSKIGARSRAAPVLRVSVVLQSMLFLSSWSGVEMRPLADHPYNWIGLMLLGTMGSISDAAAESPSASQAPPPVLFSCYSSQTWTSEITGAMTRNATAQASVPRTRAGYAAAVGAFTRDREKADTELRKADADWRKCPNGSPCQAESFSRSLSAFVARDAAEKCIADATLSPAKMQWIAEAIKDGYDESVAVTILPRVVPTEAMIASRMQDALAEQQSKTLFDAKQAVAAYYFAYDMALIWPALAKLSPDDQVAVTNRLLQKRRLSLDGFHSLRELTQAGYLWRDILFLLVESRRPQEPMLPRRL